MSDERPGEYRYVRGRTVDPETGRPSGDEAIPVADVVQAKLEAADAQLPHRAARRQPRWGSRRGRLLGPVQELEDSLWAHASPPHRRGLSQKLIWVGSGALVTVVGMVVLGAQVPDRVAATPAAAVREQAAEPVVAKRDGDAAAGQTATTGDARAMRAAAGPESRDARSGSDDATVRVADASERAAGEGTGASDLAPQPSESVQPPAAREPAVAPVVVPTVKIAINATPWALIEIDGEQVGETPLAGVELAVGRHRFLARMPDGSVRERVTHVDAGSGAVLFE